MPEMSQLSIRLPKADREALKHVAWVKGVDVADEIREAVSGHLAKLRVDKDFLVQEKERIEQQRAAFHALDPDAS
jgi:hypothetical protein